MGLTTVNSDGMKSAKTKLKELGLTDDELAAILRI
tara:strand:- start:144 stop:248 length:105 start_codon:yes stop_codon:yes gene_type:complete